MLMHVSPIYQEVHELGMIVYASMLPASRQLCHASRKLESGFRRGRCSATVSTSAADWGLAPRSNYGQIHNCFVDALFLPCIRNQRFNAGAWRKLRAPCMQMNWSDNAFALPIGGLALLEILHKNVTMNKLVL